ncbi:MAG: hypothetical protein GY720_15485, partial [bacterium]|nr:hypothetical protein [bacterium]
MTMVGKSGTRRFPPIDRIQLHVRKAVRQSTRSFIMVLALLVAIYVVSEATGQADANLVLGWILAYVAFIVILRALGAQPRTVYINLTLMAAFFALAVAGLVIDFGLLLIPAWATVSVYAFAAPLLVMSYVLRQERITIDLIFGALCVYLFVGVNFAIV